LKNLKSILSRTFLLIGCILLSSILVAEKRGLIIAIGDYPSEGLWPKISSVNDIPHIKSAFNSIGFIDDHIMIIKDSQATKAGILKAFEKLMDDSQPGDLVFIHYSGHGQQTVDANGDEIDGLDEAIVPFDSPLNYDDLHYRGENLITDDEISDITFRLREKIGTEGQLLLIMDSCHSGSGTRGSGRSRGTDKVMAPDNYKPKSGSSEPNMGVTIDDDNVAPMASFFGASSRELNYETLDDQINPVGSLSYAFASVISKMKNTFSYSELYERIKLKMKSIAPNQNPQWEGPSDGYFLGGQATKEMVLYSVKSISDKKVIVSVGTLSEVYEGSVIELYSIDQIKVIGTGEVTASYLTSCEVTMDESIVVEQDELIKVKVIERVAAPISCQVSAELSELGNWAEIVEEVIVEPYIKSVETNAEIFITSEDDVIKLKDKQGTILYQKPYRESRLKGYTFQIKKIILSYMQGGYMRDFESESQNLFVEFDMVEVDCNDKGIEKKSIHDNSISVGSCIKIKAKNTGTKPAYFSVIDIQPNNVINLVIPAVSLGYTASEYYLEPGEEFETNYSIEIGEPYGAEVMKLIATNEPLDLANIMSNNGSLSRGIDRSHPFENLFSATFQNNTRGAKVKKPNVEEVGTTTKYFNIIK